VIELQRLKGHFIYRNKRKKEMYFHVKSMRLKTTVFCGYEMCLKVCLCNVEGPNLQRCYAMMMCNYISIFHKTAVREKCLPVDWLTTRE
jgi:hypothetical protein